MSPTFGKPEQSNPETGPELDDDRLHIDKPAETPLFHVERPVAQKVMYAPG